MRSAVAFMFTALALLACSSTPPPAASTTPAASASSGDEAVADNTPPRADEPPLAEDDLARAGHSLFDRACGACHGADGVALANLNLSAERAGASLRVGSDPPAIAPAFAGVVTEQDAPALVAYLRTIHAVR